ncbi:LacI family DNA-binding transcriptional regulator [Streptomyces himalayensis]|uniref:LacI family DNA-binding transcriptional regulator n=2 Tax=Streptomyces himalayensis TaxID=2820085 RepID=A0A7W2D2T9_9ACTN|nr:LacI family DNA-binding transcriptional regulator [Streptomyces himalayensis]MBA2951778.1 LacI family DNA-binding transcriptional regulator [Streptomyces himalayensis subsp. himalayensis]MBA4863742.1 LacI family DNA-binding transcriptional regulator [Streptomyces himalayensis subsp. aureolus]
MSERDDSTPRAVTMRDVAQAAGVSVSTVSHVVNDKKGARIGKEARERVQRAVQELGYRPNAMAKVLVKGHSRFLGLVADAIASTPFAGQIIRGAQDEAWRHGYVLLVANTEGNEAAETEAIAMMLEHKVRGVLYSAWYHREVEPPAGLTETDCVLVNCFAPGGDLPAVVPDEVAGGYEATRMLLAEGHRRIGFINTTSPSPAHDGRLEGYRRALTDAGVSFEPDLVVDARPDQEGGFEAIGPLLAQDVTGVFCHNDRVAMGVYDGVRERGLRVPGDLAVVGFDNQEVIAAHLRPPLSTVALPHYELGRVGVRVLLGLDQPADDGRVVVGCPPVHRASVNVTAGVNGPPAAPH